MNVKKVEELSQNRIKLLVFGQSGIGKTYLAKTFNDTSKVLIISAEAGVLSLTGSNIDVIDISQQDDGKLIPEKDRFDKLKQVYSFLLRPECREKYDTIMIDSITEIGQNLTASLLSKYPDKKDSFNVWNDYTNIMRSFIKSFRDLPFYNIIFTALSTEEKDEVGRRIFKINLNGKKLPEEIPGLLDIVVYYTKIEDENGDEKRVLITCPTSKSIGKDRSGKLSKMEPPNLQIIFNKIRGESSNV
jgi:hypothetical protein